MDGLVQARLFGSILANVDVNACVDDQGTRLVAGGAHGGQPFGLRLGVDQPAVAVVVCVFQVA